MEIGAQNRNHIVIFKKKKSESVVISYTPKSGLGGAPMQVWLLADEPHGTKGMLWV